MLDERVNRPDKNRVGISSRSNAYCAFYNGRCIAIPLVAQGPLYGAGNGKDHGAAAENFGYDRAPDNLARSAYLRKDKKMSLWQRLKTYLTTCSLKTKDGKPFLRAEAALKKAETEIIEIEKMRAQQEQRLTRMEQATIDHDTEWFLTLERKKRPYG
jgi:hypothetical protein